MVFRFDDFELDLDTVELRVRGQRQPIEPQVFEVLAVLVQHRDRMVSKEELLDAVWHHRFVTDSAVTSRIKSARRAIGDDGSAQRLIRTVHGRGYQFVGAVEETVKPSRTPTAPTAWTPSTAVATASRAAHRRDHWRTPRRHCRARAL
jgi:DNA-binding winged helix-turn-helix (wHTH) protein